jgi:hypothetical protein
VLVTAAEKCILEGTNLCPKNITFTTYERAWIAKNINTPGKYVVNSTQMAGSNTVTVPGYTMPPTEESSKAKRKHVRK